MIRQAFVSGCVLACLGASACASRLHPRGVVPSGRVWTGIDVLEADGFRELHGLRIGLITNYTGRDSGGRLTAEVLAAAPGVTLAAIFSPEHGFAGASEEASIGGGAITLAGRVIPVHSLYRGGMAGMRPTRDDLYGLDALVFDIQDIGARFYTYLATMGMAMEEASRTGIAFIVLDRPNPINGLTVEGPMLLDRDLLALTPTAYFPVPVRHGLTAGEMALLHKVGVRGLRIKIVRMRGWKRRMWYDQTGLPWVVPSVNMPDLAAAMLYPGIGLFEASNLSVGRGTPHPFGWVGATWLDAGTVLGRLEKVPMAGVSFTAQDVIPAKSVYAGQVCHGVRIMVSDRDAFRPLEVFLRIEQVVRQTHPKAFQWRWDEVRKMMGSREFQHLIEGGAAPAKIKDLFDLDAARFERARRRYLLY